MLRSTRVLFVSALISLIAACGSQQNGGGDDSGNGSDARADASGDGGGDAARDVARAHDGGDAGGEICGNGLDDDRNGLVDDTCTCQPSQMQRCYAGDPRQAGVGACGWGQQSCAGSSEIGTWGPCMGSGHSSAETCDGHDNDCNGMTDDGLGSTTCGSGACARTVMNCVGGVPQTCTAMVASAEVCDGVDNDCNGMTDDGLPMLTCGVGPCMHSVSSCNAGAPATCTPLPSSPEVCDGIDNDCNGSTDDGLGTTSCGSGTCIRTVMNCVGGVAQTCDATPASPEVCDGVDNDCNGVIDDGLGSTTCGTGPCARTVDNCVMGVAQTCTAGSGSAEVCNGIDDDCNGQTDEGIPSAPCTLTGMPCRTGGTTCASGTTSCVAVGVVPTGTPCPGGVCDMGVCHPPVNCQGSFGACSVTCGSGVQTYTITQPAQYGGAACPYNNGDTQPCDMGACPPSCQIINYPHISWTCPADGDHYEYVAPLGCYCESYDSAGHGVNCSQGYAYSAPHCNPEPLTNFVADAGSCYCQM